MDARRLYILRGLPSAGKSTLAKLIAPDANISLDELRAELGRNVIDDRNFYITLRNMERDLVRSWLREGRTPIAIHDVNATRSDVAEWAALAASYGYQWAVVHVETDLNDFDLAMRSDTGCPPSAIAKFRERWQSWGGMSAL